jgi:hypothetical protein
MGAPDHPNEFVRVVAEDLTLFLSRDVLSSLKPRQTRFLVAVGGYGRFWIELVGEAD